VAKVVKSFGIDEIAATATTTIAGEPFGILDQIGKCGEPYGCSLYAPFVLILLTDHQGAGQVRLKKPDGFRHSYSLGSQIVIRLRGPAIQDVIWRAFENIEIGLKPIYDLRQTRTKNKDYDERWIRFDIQIPKGSIIRERVAVGAVPENTIISVWEKQ
jgi:hypothetical protein